MVVPIPWSEFDINKPKTWDIVKKFQQPIECPVCKSTDVMEELGAMGPGIERLVYSCGCSIETDEEGTTYRKYNGTIVDVENPK